jgi:hypothetical protein
MKKTAMIITLCVVTLALVAPGTAFADEEKSSKELKLDSQRAKINEVAQETLQKLFAENSKAKALYDEAIGWAVFDNTKVAVGISGGGGNGVAVSNIDKGWQADAGATASAGKNAAEVKTNFVNGLAIYQLTDKGLMLNADIAGTKYKLNDKLNE